ncbi:exopolysaccharide biosynthesis polyprenyl glycosylphosphotransferase [Persicobacter psychrovividus]|uniref:Undecaprenyl-phosphate glucose phosphotransferase n=1 Tax=Persicobacter psychrovividus TaxID=387638 RepID=A0ABN6LF04_9BACT|nr:undecaprenyl-phosphate glucose phosphotransferase [Persicobacter psychrovividus]
MKVRFNKFWLVFLTAIDLVFVFSSLQIAYLLTFKTNEIEDYYLSFFLFYSIGWVVSSFFSHIARLQWDTDLKEILLMNLYGFIMHIIAVIGIVSLYDNLAFSYSFIFFAAVLTLLFTSSVRIVFFFVLENFSHKAQEHFNVVVYGVNEDMRNLRQYFIKNQDLGYKFSGIYGQADRAPDSMEFLGNFEALKSKLDSGAIDMIYITAPIETHSMKEWHEFSENCDRNCIHLGMSTKMSVLLDRKVKEVVNFGGVDIVLKRPLPLSNYSNVLAKRIFDIVFSSFVIFFIFPFILPIIALIIKLESPGPIFFKQLRPGKKNKLFKCYKFRTMRVNNVGALQASKNDPRITRFGAIMRKTSIDELPQFFNVLFGDMSVVGPRPNMVIQLEEFGKTIRSYSERHMVTPGITGYAQINGFRGETRADGAMEKRVQYDVEYMENWTLGLDVKIIFLTVYNMIRGEKNAY